MKSVPPIPSCSNENFCFHVGDYSFGFNGKELDKEGMGGGASTYDYGFRIYNSALAKFLSVDPLSHKFAFYSVYQYAGNKPIVAIDLDGLEDVWIHEYLASDGKSMQQDIYYKGEPEYDVWKQSAIATLHLNPKDIPAEGIFTTRQEWNNDGVTFELRTTITPPCVIAANHTFIAGISKLYNQTMTSATEGLNYFSDPKNRYALEGSSDGGNYGGELQGEEGLKKYSQGLDWVGMACESTGILAPLGKGLCITSDVIDSALDYKNLDVWTATENLGIRALSYGFGEVVEKLAPGSVDEIGEKIGDFSIKVATKMSEDGATDANAKASINEKKVSLRSSTSERY